MDFFSHQVIHHGRNLCIARDRGVQNACWTPSVTQRIRRYETDASGIPRSLGRRFRNGVVCGPRDNTSPNPALEKLADTALERPRNSKRRTVTSVLTDIATKTYRSISARNAVLARHSKYPGISDSDSFGFGVRVIVDGAWGFASSPQVTRRRSRESRVRL